MGCSAGTARDANDIKAASEFITEAERKQNVDESLVLYKQAEICLKNVHGGNDVKIDCYMKMAKAYNQKFKNSERKYYLMKAKVLGSKEAAIQLEEVIKHETVDYLNNNNIVPADILVKKENIFTSNEKIKRKTKIVCTLG
jgi:hypothetical protein